MKISQLNTQKRFKIVTNLNATKRSSSKNLRVFYKKSDQKANSRATVQALEQEKTIRYISKYLLTSKKVSQRSHTNSHALRKRFEPARISYGNARGTKLLRNLSIQDGGTQGKHLSE